MKQTKKQFIKNWLSNFRLGTLPLACCGVVTGNALVIASGNRISMAIFVFSILTAVLLQIVSNLANDYGDVLKGTDTAERLGDKRGLQNGFITFKQIRITIAVFGALSLISGMILIALSCETLTDVVVFLVLGAICLIAAITYTMGSYAYGYYGLGDLSVLTFFGYAGVMGSYYLQVHQIGLYSFLPATACGLLGTLVLNVNNMRDIQEDSRNGKFTIPVHLGTHKARYYHFALLAGSLFCLVLFALLYSANNPYIWLFLLALPLFYLNGIAVFRHKEPIQLQKQLGMAIKINVCTMTLFSIGLFLG